MATKRFPVKVEFERPEWMDGESRVVITVNGYAHRYPWHWSDNLRTLVRNAVTENYRVTGFPRVENDRKQGHYIVTAEVY